MKICNEQLADLLKQYEETHDEKLISHMAVMIRAMRGEGDAILTQRALLIIDEAIEKTGGGSC